MGFLDSIKKFFNLTDRDEKSDNLDEELQKEKKVDTKNIKQKLDIEEDDIEEDDIEEDDIDIMARKAFEAKNNGKFERALNIWDEFSDEYPELAHQAKARKAKIYIVIGDEKSAKKELLSFFEWYSKKGSLDYSSRYFTIFVSALQDLGYQIGNWSDSEDYIKNISGEDVSLDKELTMERIKKGLDYLKEKEVWSSSLEDIEKNLGML